MKFSLLILAVLTVIIIQAQTGYQQLQVSGGVSASNASLVSIQFERANTHKIHLGLLIQALSYKPGKFQHYPIRDSARFISAGLYLKKDMYSTKNFCSSIYLGGAIGTNTHNLIFYPLGGLEQGLFVCPKIQLFISESAFYLRSSNVSETFQPVLQMGIKCWL